MGGVGKLRRLREGVRRTRLKPFTPVWSRTATACQLLCGGGDVRLLILREAGEIVSSFCRVVFLSLRVEVTLRGMRDAWTVPLMWLWGWCVCESDDVVIVCYAEDRCWCWEGESRAQRENVALERGRRCYGCWYRCEFVLLEVLHVVSRLALRCAAL